MAAVVRIDANPLVSSIYQQHESEFYHSDREEEEPQRKGLEQKSSPSLVNEIPETITPPRTSRKVMYDNDDVDNLGDNALSQTSENFMAAAPPSLASPHTTDSIASLQEIFDSDSPCVRNKSNVTCVIPLPPMGDARRRMETSPLEVSSALMTPPGDKEPVTVGAADDLGTPPTSLHVVPSLDTKQLISLGAEQDQQQQQQQHQMQQQQVQQHQQYQYQQQQHLQMRPAAAPPILYSAIGSLETCGATSFGSLNKRYLTASGREFSHSTLPPGAQTQSNLIAPRNLLATQHGSGMPITIPNLLPPQKSLLSQNIQAPNDATKAEGVPRNSDQTQNKNTSNKKRESVNQKSNPISSGDLAKAKAAESGATLSATGTETGKSVGAAILRNAEGIRKPKLKKDKKAVTIDEASFQRKKVRKPKAKAKPVEMFRPSCDAYTPRMEKKKITYKPAEMRTPVQSMATPMGTLSRPNFRDALRRVAMILHQHIVKIERRFEVSSARPTTGRRHDEGLFKACMKDQFAEDNFATPLYKCTVVRMAMARPGVVCGQRRIRVKYNIPSEEEIYEFAHRLFKAVQLSSECSIVCLIYVERLMEVAKVPLLATTWRPIFMCGLLLASKVWQDLSSWNIEFASVYPRFSLDSINRLELQFLRMVKWDLYISSSLYAKYYFALRSLVEKTDFRQRYNRLVGGVGSVDHSEAMKISKRSEQVKEEAILQLSRSM